MPAIQRNGRKAHFHSNVAFGDLVFCTGLVARDREVSMREQTAMLLSRLGEILQEAGSSRNHVLQCTVYITDMSLKDEMNEAWAEYFGDHLPARATVCVAELGAGALIEVVAVAGKVG